MSDQYAGFFNPEAFFNIVSMGRLCSSRSIVTTMLSTGWETLIRLEYCYATVWWSCQILYRLWQYLIGMISEARRSGNAIRFSSGNSCFLFTFGIAMWNLLACIKCSTVWYPCCYDTVIGKEMYLPLSASLNSPHSVAIYTHTHLPT